MLARRASMLLVLPLLACRSGSPMSGGFTGWFSGWDDLAYQGLSLEACVCVLCEAKQVDPQALNRLQGGEWRFGSDRVASECLQPLPLLGVAIFDETGTCADVNWLGDEDLSKMPLGSADLARWIRETRPPKEPVTIDVCLITSGDALPQTTLLRFEFTATYTPGGEIMVHCNCAERVPAWSLPLPEWADRPHRAGAIAFRR